MGAGKSCVGRLLAERTSWPLYETDELVSDRFALRISDVFARYGEDAFREAEAQVVQALPQARAIVATGGGVVLRKGNVERLRALGAIVHLTASEDVLFRRLSRDNARPLLQSADPRSKLSEMLQARASLYRDAADVVMDTSAMTEDEVAEVILGEMAKLCTPIA